jgi:hypothetical protein
VVVLTGFALFRLGSACGGIDWVLFSQDRIRLFLLETLNNLILPSIMVNVQEIH